jgi:hypothetical protein
VFVWVRMVSVCAWGIVWGIATGASIVIMIVIVIGMTGGSVDTVGIATPSGAMATELRFAIASKLGGEWSHSGPFPTLLYATLCNANALPPSPVLTKPMRASAAKTASTFAMDRGKIMPPSVRTSQAENG